MLDDKSYEQVVNIHYQVNINLLYKIISHDIQWVGDNTHLVINFGQKDQDTTSTLFCIFGPIFRGDVIAKKKYFLEGKFRQGVTM